MFYNLAFWLLVFSYSAEKIPICKREPFRSIHKCTPRVSTITDWNKCLAKRRNLTWAQATLLYEQHFARSTILIWAKQNRAIPTKWMPLKTMPLLFKAWQRLWRQDHCYECLLKLFKITGLKLSKIKRFGVVLSHEPQLGCPNHPVRGAPRIALAEEAEEKVLDLSPKPQTKD